MDEYEMIANYLDMAFEDSVSGYVLDEGYDPGFYTEEDELYDLELEGWNVADAMSNAD